MYGQKHPLTYQSSQGEKLVWNLTFSQTGWLLVGGAISFYARKFIPNLPFDDILYKHLHHLFPLAVCAFFGFFKEGSTDLPYFSYFVYWISFHQRKRTLLYKRGSGN